MDPRIEINPILEPTTNIFYDLPPFEIRDPYEFAFPTEQRLWIRERDGNYSNMPIFENGKFVGFDKTRVDLNVHHITPQYWYKMNFSSSKAGKMMHNPINGISLDIKNHNNIHCNWLDQYKTDYYVMPGSYKRKVTFEQHVQKQVDQGLPFWVNSYDGYFVATATIKTYEFMHATNTFPFPDGWVDTVETEYAKLLAMSPSLVESLYRAI